MSHHLNTGSSQAIALRPPHSVMRLARMGAAHRSRLSFMPALLRRIAREQWGFERREWVIDDCGVGHAVYTVYGPQHAYSLVAFAHDLPAAQRSDRVIATAWDATFTLFDGVPQATDIERLRLNVPHQEAGRVSDQELTLARANRSVRLWQEVVDALAAGQQPDMDRVGQVGYLMRTTAVYGSGKFGAADRSKTAQRPELAAPFRAEMLSVWLIRAFTLDLVEHMARVQGGAKATTLSAQNRREIGVGNSTGLGMAPFLMNHPALLHQWMWCRETAIARVRAIEQADAKAQRVFQQALAQAIENAQQWVSDHPLQQAKIAQLREDLQRLHAHLDTGALDASQPWDGLVRWSEQSLSLEGQEQLLSLMLEPYGEQVDDLAEQMGIDESQAFTIDGAMSLAQLQDLLNQHYAWVADIDFAQAEAQARFWYVSEEKLEPRLGERATEPGAELELPLSAALQVHALQQSLRQTSCTTVAALLNQQPEHRHAVRRVQRCAHYPYAEIQDNLNDAHMLPIDLLRCKLAFFGATRFDPRSDRWVRISMFQGDPSPQEACHAVSPRVGSPRAEHQTTAVASPSSPGASTYSLAEIEALSKRAARGAGLSWGLAEEAGKAARWLHAHGLNGTRDLSDLLRQNQGQHERDLCPHEQVSAWTTDTGAPACPLMAGVTLLDHIGLQNRWPMRLASVTHAVLLLPFLARAARLRGQALTAQWDAVSVQIDAQGRVYATEQRGLDAHHAQAVSVHLSPDERAPSAQAWTDSPLACDVSTACWSQLQALAQKTLVPASASSRAGAGSSLTDND